MHAASRMRAPEWLGGCLKTLGRWQYFADHLIVGQQLQIGITDVFAVAHAKGAHLGGQLGATTARKRSAWTLS